MDSVRLRGGRPVPADAARSTTIGPRTFTGAVPALACPKCAESFTDGPGLEHEAARWLAANGFTTGDEIRFMRMAAKLRAVDLADRHAERDTSTLQIARTGCSACRIPA